MTEQDKEQLKEKVGSWLNENVKLIFKSLKTKISTLVIWYGQRNKDPM
jgi:hypothetical protein